MDLIDINLSIRFFFAYITCYFKFVYRKHVLFLLARQLQIWKGLFFDHPTIVFVWFWPSNSKTGYFRPSNSLNCFTIGHWPSAVLMGGFNFFYLQFSP
jgi:hypothetical protein